MKRCPKEPVLNSVNIEHGYRLSVSSCQRNTLTCIDAAALRWEVKVKYELRWFK